ncbi:MAG: phosphoserine phosphatase [Candidatus Thermoplasmatota archaeon]|nr:phosphoserine phosphatase [Candidatus Thermoplasmatota archaeon]
MSEYLDELDRKRNKLNQEAESHRKKRDRLNQETKRFAEQRDQLNSQVKKLLSEANRFKEKRDELNSKVREQKAVRDKLTKEYTDLKSQLDRLKKSRISYSEEQSLGKLKKELHGLEFKQQTSVLEADKERSLIERISHIKKEIKKKEKEMEGNEEIRELIQKVREAKKRMDESHHQVNEYADLAQNEHDTMIERFSDSDRIRKDADISQEKFVESKIKADDEHRKHIELIHLVHDIDKIIFALKQRKKVAERKPGKVQAQAAPSPVQSGKAEAEKIYEKFKKGEKISTEDLMLLQKHGFL